MTKPLRLALIYGSVRQDRFCDTVAEWTVAEASRHPNFELELIDPRSEWPAIDFDRFRRQIDGADAVLVVTPEYNRSYPGPLKVLIDSTSQEWHAKPIAFVSYGGVSGGLRAVEHLRHVFIELHAVPIRDSVSFQNAWEAFADGKPRDELRYARAMKTMLSRLNWWARALKAAREAQAYGEAA
jgi:NAD(P)H-dependent FMN reductase